MLSEKHNINAIILAGGQSKRMGFNKETIKIHDIPLIETQISYLQQFFKTIIVVSPNKNFYQNLNVTVVNDILPSQGPLSGLHSGLSHSDTLYNYVIACDMPYYDKTFITNQIKKLSTKDAYIVKDKYYEPFHGFYSKNIIEKIEHFLKSNHKFQDFLDTLDLDITNTFETNIFYNINTPLDLYKLENDDSSFMEYIIVKHNQTGFKELTDAVVNEYPITLYINQEKYVTLLITPSYIEELIIGYLRSEKIIDQYSDIKEFKIDLKQNKVHITIDKEINYDELNKDKLLTSGCGVGTKFHDDIEQIITDTIDSDFVITYSKVLDTSIALNNRSGLFKVTGGVHSALYTYNNQDIYFEDIGRHNAIDKVVGFITKENIQTKESYIFASGRISSDMLLKCAVVGIPIVISRSAPTSLAVELADKYGITLIGFARGDKLNIYTHPFRIRR